MARFNERFILSLASCEACLVLDDELNVLPISRHAKSIVPVVVSDETAGDDVAEVIKTKEQVELAALKESIAKTPLVGRLCLVCCWLVVGCGICCLVGGQHRHTHTPSR